jgi:hypothetical protein
MLAVALSCITGSVALAKDFCLVVDSPAVFADSQFVLKNAKLGPRTAAPVQGYYALFDSVSLTYADFYPLSGQSVVNSSGHGVLGFTVYDIFVTGSGGGGATNNFDVKLTCEPGSDGKIGIMDSCSGTFGMGGLVGHFITCGSQVKIP